MLRRHSFVSLAIAAIVSLALAAQQTRAAEEPLVNRPPFDQVVLDKANNNTVLNVLPLELPGRKLPPTREGKLSVRLLENPNQAFEVPWESVAEVRFFEAMLLAEAQRLTKKGDFDGAFDYFARLISNYPTYPGVDEAANDFLRQNALQLFQSQQIDRALAVLNSLYERNPSSPGLTAAVDTVCGKMIEQSLRKQDYAGARAVLDLWQKGFGSLNSATAAAWEQKFAAAAQRQVEEAKQDVAQKKFVAARKAIGRARDIWPQHEEARLLLAQIQRLNPSISVGVIEASPQKPVRRLDDWASLRTSRLVQPTLAELSEFGAEGGVYTSPYGEWIADETGTRLSLKLKDSGRGTSTPTAEYLSRYLLNMADPTQPQYEPDFAALVAGVTTAGSEWVHLDWSRPFVRPEALLQVPIFKPASGGDDATATPSVYGTRFAMIDSEPGSTAFNAVPTGSNSRRWLRTLVEQTYPNDDAAIAALLHGEVDVIDRVPPWQIERLRKAKGIHVDSYRLPTVHVLVPNPERPLPKQRELRRAACYGIQRDRIVQQVFLGGGSSPGYQVVSGPFPAGTSFSDPLRYAYNNQLEPRPFEPRLAAVLSTVAWSRVLDPLGKGNIELIELPKLILAHPADPVARIACETIRLQLGRAGIPIELLECSSDDLLNGRVEYDFRYAELAVWEPVVDARTLLGPKGLAGDIGGPYLYSALRQLDEATTWKDVRTRLSEIHDIVYHDLPVIPLWQTVNYFAYRTSVRGIGASPITLYQDVDKWEIEGANSPEAAPPRP